MKAKLLLAAFSCLVTWPAVAEDARQRVDQSCRAGMEILKDAALYGFPNATDEERTRAEITFTEKQDAYCGCVVKSIPFERIKPDDIRYIYYMLENATMDRTPFEQKMSYAWNGLDEQRMGIIATAFVGWILKCPS